MFGKFLPNFCHSVCFPRIPMYRLPSQKVWQIFAKLFAMANWQIGNHFLSSFETFVVLWRVTQHSSGGASLSSTRAGPAGRGVRVVPLVRPGRRAVSHGRVHPRQRCAGAGLLRRRVDIRRAVIRRGRVPLPFARRAVAQGRDVRTPPDPAPHRRRQRRAAIQGHPGGGRRRRQGGVLSSEHPVLLGRTTGDTPFGGDFNSTTWR